MKSLVEFIARRLVDNPDQVQVTQTDHEDGVVLELRVAKEDLGKVIGKSGRTARAMRTLLAAATVRTRQRVSLEILD
jgi:predicted RNA-binding protein YlqC (UPF0109 family)